MDVKDLAGLSAPLEKLIESVSCGIGTLYDPLRITRQAKAERDAELIKLDGELEKAQLIQRVAQRINFRELRAQVNIDNIVAESIQYLPEVVSDESVDPDWLLRFFDDSQKISDESIQVLWAKILAGEVAQPGQYSRITLSILKNISRTDAILFGKIASLVWQVKSSSQDKPLYFIPVKLNRPQPLESCGVTYTECLHLSALGLLNVGRDIILGSDKEVRIIGKTREKLHAPMSEMSV